VEVHVDYHEEAEEEELDEEACDGDVGAFVEGGGVAACCLDSSAWWNESAFCPLRDCVTADGWHLPADCTIKLKTSPQTKILVNHLWRIKVYSSPSTRVTIRPSAM